MSQKPKAFIFDLNGTMIDDMEYHIRAWHYLVNNELGGKLDYQQVKKEMYGKNSEVLMRIFGEGRFTQQEMDRLSVDKEKGYQKEYRPHLKLIDGLHLFLERAYQHQILMGIGSAAITFNIDFVLDNLDLRHYFKAIVSADDVQRSKPDPETYLEAAAILKVEPASCIVFEDAPKGVEAAANANMKCIVITTMHTKDEFADFNNIIHFIQDYSDSFLNQFFQ
ncbi:MAG: HAD family phosphatase [Bacteroidetes bacterium]|nr:HAD family phosphatase [Bacteroidota bacterium]